jgi:hypothetical protein
MINKSISPIPVERRLRYYCANCRATSTFVQINLEDVWICIGDAAALREGCGKRLRPRASGDATPRTSAEF